MGRPDQWERNICECAGGRALEGGDDGAFKLIIIRAGLTKDGRRYYSPECIKRAAEDGVFDNTKMFCDHSGPMDQARGSRSNRDWWATTGETWYDEETQSVQAAAVAHVDQALAILRNQVSRDSQEFSHDSFVEYHKDEQDGKRVMAVDRIVQSNSVDFVPFGNAGGQVTEAVDDPEGEVDMTPDEVKAAVREGLAEVLGDRLDGMIEGIFALKTILMDWTAAQGDPMEEAAPAEPSVETPTEEVPAEEPEPEVEVEEATIPKQELELLGTAAAITVRLDEHPSLTATERKRVLESVCANEPEFDIEKIKEAVDAAVVAVQEETRALLREHGSKTTIRSAGPTAPVAPDGDPRARANEMLRARGISDELMEQFETVTAEEGR
jgi:hypothetical protein